MMVVVVVAATAAAVAADAAIMVSCGFGIVMVFSCVQSIPSGCTYWNAIQTQI
jgi:hypothetical protein